MASAAVFLARPADEGVPAAVEEAERSDGTPMTARTHLAVAQTEAERTFASVCVTAVWYGVGSGVPRKAR